MGSSKVLAVAAAPCGRRLLFLLALLFPALARGGEDSLRLTLDDAVRLALERNRRLAVAANREASAREGIREARGAFFPSLSLRAGFTLLDEAPYIPAESFRRLFDGLRDPFEELVAGGVLDPASLEGLRPEGARKIVLGDEENYAAGIYVRQPLFTGYALRGGLAIARHREAAERWRAAREREEVRFAATEAYLRLVSARAANRIAVEAAARVRAHVADLEALLAEGVIIESDLLKAKVELSRADLAEAKSAHDARNASALLCHETGLSLGTPIVPADSLPPPAVARETAGALTGAALDRRADRKALAERIEIDRQAIRVERGRRLPALFFLGAYEWKRPDREFENEFYDSWNVGVALEMNLFDGGRTSGRVARARLDEARLRELFAMQEEAIALEVEQVFLLCEDARRLAAVAEEEVARAEENLRVAEESFREGMVTNTDLLDAQALLTQARMERVRALADLSLAGARLRLAVGAPAGGE